MAAQRSPSGPAAGQRTRQPRSGGGLSAFKSADCSGESVGGPNDWLVAVPGQHCTEQSRVEFRPEEVGPSVGRRTGEPRFAIAKEHVFGVDAVDIEVFRL